MKTFQEFMSICEAYDAAFMSGAQIRSAGEGGRVGTLRKKTTPEKRRKSQPKAGGERKPTEYKARKDIGTQKAASTRVQQPTQSRGSAALSPREAQRKAALERRAKAAGQKTPTAAELLSKKKPVEVDKRPEGQPKRAVVGMSRKERSRIIKQGQKKLETLVRQSEAEKQGKKPEDIKLTGGKSGEKYQTWK
jgi:hypothetical protein